MIFDSLLHVIDYCHSRDTTHCDLHADNILVSDDLIKDGLLVIDFGSGHLLNRDGQTPNRGAPEFKLHEGGRSQGARLDMRSIGDQQSAKGNDYSALSSLIHFYRTNFFTDASPVQNEAIVDFQQALNRSTTYEQLRQKLSNIRSPFLALQELVKDFESTSLQARKTIPLPVNRSVEVGDKHLDIINTGIFQRLRCVKQLSFCDLYFPGANHTRFEHSIGVFDLLHKVIRTLSADAGFRSAYTTEQLRACMLAGLLHDVGHYPFAHTIEQYAYARFQKDLKLIDLVSHKTHSEAILDRDVDLQEALKQSLLSRKCG
jgi:serine/threonine protein kinase